MAQSMTPGSPKHRRGVPSNVSFSNVNEAYDNHSPLPDLGRDTDARSGPGSHQGTSVSGDKTHTLDLRHQWVLCKIGEAFDFEGEGNFTRTLAERTLQKHDNYGLLSNFFDNRTRADIPVIFVSMRKGAGKQKKRGAVTSLFSLSSTPPNLVEFSDKVLYFLRLNDDPVKEISIESEVVYGSVEGPILTHLHEVMANIYDRQLRQTDIKGLVRLEKKARPHVEASKELAALFEQFDDLIIHLSDASSSLDARVELTPPHDDSTVPTTAPGSSTNLTGDDKKATLDTDTPTKDAKSPLLSRLTEGTGSHRSAAADIVKGSSGVASIIGGKTDSSATMSRSGTSALLFGDTFTNTIRDISLHWAKEIAPEFAEKSNRTLAKWADTIEQALIDTDQDLAQELKNDQVGPASELAHWKVRMAKLCSITDQLREPRNKRVITSVMGSSGDPELQKRWRALDIQITDAANEAKDNVKYLATFDSLCKPLYRSTPDRIVDIIAPLLNAVRTIHSIARYYSTPERMLALFIKISNQLVINCRSYIRGKSNDIWEHPRDQLIFKLKSCIDLSDAYQDQYHLIKESLKQNPTHPQWDFNEEVIFGRFEALCNRLLKIIDLLNSVEQFSLLAEAKEEVDVDGIDQCIQDFQGTFRILKRKRYDILDFTQRDFEQDYLGFTRTVLKLENKVQSLINHSFENVTRTTSAIRVLEQFKATFRKGNLKVDLDSKYVYIMGAYKRDLELIRKMYELNKKDPPTPRNFPPAAGCIAWARQLHRRIEGPMKLFSVHPFILGLPEAKPTIQMYNKVAKALVKFEGLWYRGWCNAVDQARAGLQATLLVRDETTGKLYVNFDRQIMQLIREAKCLERMGITIPPAVVVLCLQEERLKTTAEALAALLTRYNKLVGSIPDMWLPLMQKRMQLLKRKISVGATKLTWSSVNIEQYVESASTTMDEISAVLSKAIEMDSYRIKNDIEFVRNAILVEVPDTIQSVDDFLLSVTTRSQQYAKTLQEKNASLEIAVMDLVAVLSTGLPLKDAAAASQEVMRYYERTLFDALLACFQNSVKVLTDRFEAGDAYSVCWVVMPLFPMRFAFQNGHILIEPGLNEIEVAARSVVTTMLGTFKHIFVWNQDVDNVPKDSLTSFYEEISTDFIIGVAVLVLKGTFEGLALRVQDYVQCFLNFESLWTEAQEKVFKVFFSQEPTIGQMEDKFIEYKEIASEIQNLPEIRNMAAVSMHAQELKSSLIKLAEEWSRGFAAQVRQRAEATLEKLKHEIDLAHQKLGQKIEDFEDLHYIMDVLRAHRIMEDEFDGRFQPTADIFKLLDKYHIDKDSDDSSDDEDSTDPVGDLLSAWRNLKARATIVGNQVHAMQDDFRERLENFGTQLKKDASKFASEYDREGPMVRGVKPKVASDRLRRFRDQFETLEHRQQTHWGAEHLFGLPATAYPDLVRIAKELRLLSPLYDLYNTVLETRKDHESTPWQSVDFDQMTQELSDFQTRCRMLPKGLREWDAYNALKNAIDDLAQTLPLVQGLTASYVRERHWTRLSELTNYSFDMGESVLLKYLLEAPLLDNLEVVEDICYSAKKEAEIETKLLSISAMWREREFKFASFRNRGDLMLKGDDTNEIVTSLEECEMVLASLSSSRYAGPFKVELQSWLSKLSVSSEIIENWLVVQSQWVYLEAVFSSADIARQLPLEAKRFQQIDKTWVKMMNNATSSPNVVQLCYSDEALQHLLPHLIEQMELCQKSLEGYLEMKRTLFPRFYFVSNAVLLEILGQSSDPSAVQSHLRSVFDNIAAVGFDETSRIKSINAMISGEGEVIPFRENMPIEGNVEEWLLALEGCMRTELKNLIRDLALDLTTFKDFKELTQHLIHSDQVGGQLALIGLQLAWVRDVEDTLRRAKSEVGIMKVTNRRIGSMLKYLTQLTTEEMSKRQRVKVETMVTIQVHQRDVFESMVARHVKTPTDFEWLKQTRIYWKPEHDDLQISICDIDFFYTYEYLGCTERLVITPLTDRCYITLSQALGMQMGGAPAGPAGTGKTETVKDMGKQLGKYVVVFNCSDQMDYKGLGKTFKGLAMSGAWGCFDEFNRIELEVLSVVSQQIQCILTALRDRSASFKFVDGHELTLNKGCGLFITMNPGYAGRHELPENLKMLFRGVSMMVPDSQIIMRVKLAASGFQDNINLSRKLAILYKLCKDQLSKQRHYDFGLRNVLSVLRTCGAAKRESGTEEESLILLRVVRDMNLSKLNDEDSILFVALLDDLFPDKAVATKIHEDLEAAIAEECEKSHMIDYPDWHHKVIQLYETSLVRHGIMVLGPSGSGKSSCIRTLMRGLTKCGVPHKEVRMNPKSITAAQMYGRLDVVSNEWTDGIFSILWRKATKRKEPVWIWLDGPVDTIWIENLNSVLDDNKTLTLSNSDRITMTDTMRLIFEPAHLDNASPATVSRAGMIFMGPQILGWKPLVSAWNKKKASQEVMEAPLFAELALDHFEDLFRFMLESCVPVMKNADVNLVSSFLTIVDGILIQLAAEKHAQVSRETLEKLFVFATVWSLGALLEPSDQARLSEFLTTRGLALPNLSSDEGGTTVYDYTVDVPSGQWVHWQSRVPEYVYPAKNPPPYASIFVPTVDSVRTEYLIHLVAQQNKCVLLTGAGGTAKTVTLTNYLNSRALENPERYGTKFVSFSSTSSPLSFQGVIEGSVEKRQGKTYGPPGNRHLLVFIDDINLPQINEWGDQITNELLRQLVEDIGFYDLNKPGEFSSIVDLQFFGAMPHPGGGRNDIPARLKRHFTIFNCSFPSPPSIERIFGTILEGHFSGETGFGNEVVKCAPVLASLTRTLWNETKNKMLPTPAKFHYVFNLRDFSRIVHGLLKARPAVITNADLLISLWAHECSRVLADRFIEVADVEWFDQATKKLVSDHFDHHFARRALKSASNGEPTWFVDFLRDPEIPDDFDPEVEIPDHRVYEPIPSIDVLRERVHMYIEEAGEVHRGPKFDDLVMFDDALKHLIRIHRVIRTPRGNAMLVGVGGSGKQSLTKLASFIAGNEIVQLTITRTYNTNNLLDDLKVIYRTCGEKGKPVTFLITDAEIKEESFLEYFNNILASGEVPNLFQKDELEIIITELRAVSRKERPEMKDTDANLYKFFIERVRDNLHMVLCFSPVGETFRQRSIKFPGLLSGCTVDWFWAWPMEALIGVSEQYLADSPIECVPKVKDALAVHMASVHTIVQKLLGEYFEKFRRQISVTPKSYLSYLNHFKKLYVEKLEEIRRLSDNLTIGLDKLDQAAEDVKEMQVELEVKEVELEKAQAASDLILQDVTAETAAAEKKKAEVEEVQKQCEELAARIAKEKAEAEAEYELAKPALIAAREALDLIKPNDIATLKKLAQPPNLIRRIMDGVLLVRRLGIHRSKIDPQFYPDKTVMLHSYDLSIKAMTDAKYLQYLMNFDADAMTGEDCELLQPYFDMEDFNFETAKAASGNVAGLCNWLRAMVEYHYIAKDVAPKIQAVKEAEYALAQAQQQVEDAKAQVAEKAEIVRKITVKYEAALEDKRLIQEDADLTKRRLESAHALITGLAGEKERWTEQRGELEDMIIRLVGDVCLTASFIGYAGPFNQEYRSVLHTMWIKDLKDKLIPISANHNIIEFMADEGKIGEWNVQGLPTDLLSTQNGVLVTSTTKYPLLVDPQGQGRAWIMNTYGSELQVTSFDDPKFKVVLEDCVDNGHPMLIEDIEEDLDPILDPVLDKLTFRQGSMLRISVGGKDLDFSPKFKLFLTTKLANPRFSPETSAKTAVIDFTVTEKGLEEQLLSIVYRMEKPELEEERVQLQKNVTENKQKLIHLEKDLLYRLSNTQGNLVDDVELVNVLNVTKTTTVEVKRKLEESGETQEQIALVREEYRPVATRGSILYFLIDEMSLVNPMYQTSLAQFTRLFSDAISSATSSHVQSKRVAFCIQSTTFNVYKYISRGLFEEHKQLYVLRLCLKIDLQRRAITHTEYNVFLKGGASLDLNEELAKPFGWLPDEAWRNLQALSHHISLFAPLVHQVHGQNKSWKTWYDIEDVETRTVPGGFEGKLSQFQRMLFIRCWRPDRAILAASAYIESVLDESYLQPVPLDLDATWREAAPDVPIVCLLSPGSDPSGTIEALARKLKITCRAVSMGQGQDVHARAFVKQGMEEGGWTLLQNCHLGLKFLQELIVTIKSMDLSTVDPSFRLMITSAPHPKFPIGLLQTSIKLTNQPPQGVRAGLTRAMGWLTIDDVDVVDRKEWKPLLYTLCFMHTALLERAKFGALGWNIPYEFNQSDMSASVHFLSNHLYHWDVKKELSWSTIRYMICEVQYGGRITDDMDRRLMNTYGSLWLDNKIFAKDFKFHDGYVIPDYKSLQEMKTSLENIPSVDTPEMAGLHINADIAFRTRETNSVLNTLLSIQPRQAGSGGGETREDAVLRVATELALKLPHDFVKVEVKKQLQVLGARSPFSIFLAQEVDRMQVVISLVRRTLADLKLAIAGTIILSDALVAVIDSLYQGKVPASWHAVSWPAPNLSTWFQSFIQRATQYSDWLLIGRPAVFWLTGFFNPQGFITAMKQETTRAHKGQWSIDSLELRCDVLKHSSIESMSQPDEGVYIHGLYLEGCTWDSKHGKLVESEPKVLFVPMPIIHLTAISFSGTRDRRNYECPVYKTPKRTDLNFIFAVDLRTDEPPDKWVLRGVAITCSKE